MRLIDVDKLKPDTKTFTSAYSEELTEFYSQKAIDNAPSIEAEPVRHGHWYWADNVRCCSMCGQRSIYFEAPYCQWCGAKMDGKDGDTN